MSSRNVGRLVFYCRSRARARSRSLSRFDDKQELMKLLLLRSKCTPLVMKLQPGDAAPEKTALSIFASVASQGAKIRRPTANVSSLTSFTARPSHIFNERRCFLFIWWKNSFPLKLNKRRSFFICFRAALIAPFFFRGSCRRWLPLSDTLTWFVGVAFCEWIFAHLFLLSATSEWPSNLR